jgi:hypothetical protein
MQISDMTLDELRALIRETVQETLEEFFVDPDEGLEVREEVKQRLIKSLHRIQAGERGIPVKKAYKRLGLDSL